MIDSGYTQEESVNITLSVPVEKLRGIVPIDYAIISEKVLNEIDMSNLAESVMKELDIDDLTSDIKDNIDMSDFASDVCDYIDKDSLANELKGYLDGSFITNHINDLMGDYDASHKCKTGENASRIIINAIRYDLMCSTYGSDKSILDVTITDILSKFVQKEIAKNNEEIAKKNESLTFEQVVNVLDSIPGLDFNTKFQIRNALTNALYAENTLQVDTIIKAD